jgi:hypothetical protein
MNCRIRCNLHGVQEITEPGTITDLVADAARDGHQVTVRLIRDWTEVGLLDYPQRRSAGKGHGSRPALYTANQRMLLLTLLTKRSSNGIRSLARIPVALWMYWGDDYASLHQARRALMTWLGDPRASKQKAKEAAQALMGQLDNPNATRQARRQLLDTLTDIGYTGRVDLERLERAIQAVFEPDSVGVRRAIGHPAAPLTTEAVVGGLRARLEATNQLRDGIVTDEAFLQARQAHLVTFAEYARQQPVFAAGVPRHVANLYKEPTAELMINSCCSNLLTIIGIQSLHPGQPANPSDQQKHRHSAREPVTSGVKHQPELDRVHVACRASDDA